MTTLDKLTLEGAQSIFAVANTPLYLLRKLRAETGVQLLGSAFGADEVFEALNIAVLQPPQTLQDLVRPYVYLIALSLNRDKSYLERAAKLTAPHHHWFQYIGNVLIKEYQVTGVSKLTATVFDPKPRSSFKVTASNSKFPFTQGTDK